MTKLRIFQSSHVRQLILLFSMVALTAEPSASFTVQSTVRAYRRTHEHQILREFIDLLSIPNVASENANIRKNADFIFEMMKRRGLNPQLLEAKTTNVPPAVYGEWKSPGSKSTVILYAHYDGQPANSQHWKQASPWEPILRSSAIEAGGRIQNDFGKQGQIDPESRLYARSAADDKAGIIAILTALDALRARQITPAVDIKFFFEGEEEAGSPHLKEIIGLHRELLQSEAWIICDGPVHQSGRKQIIFGVRGNANIELTVFGAKRPLHSGHYGNWAPNPAMLLARLLASMKDDTGRVAISGWYDDVEPLGEAERRAILEAPRDDDQLRAQLGLKQTDGLGKSLLETVNQPSLSIIGMGSGDIGNSARNIIPSSASASLDMRLVRGNDYQRQILRFISHVRKQGFCVLDRDPTDEERLRHGLIAKITARSGGYNAERTAMDLPISRAVTMALQLTSDEPIVRVPTSGGSLPLSIITNSLRTVTITVPIANHDNNQHAENENIKLQNLWDGIESIAAIMTMRSGK